MGTFTSHELQCEQSHNPIGIGLHVFRTVPVANQYNGGRRDGTLDCDLLNTRRNWVD